MNINMNMIMFKERNKNVKMKEKNLKMKKKDIVQPGPPCSAEQNGHQPVVTLTQDP